MSGEPIPPLGQQFVILLRCPTDSFCYIAIPLG